MICIPLVIIPYQSIGRVRLGMPPGVVHSIWGAPDSSRQKNGVLTDYYALSNVAYSSGDVEGVVHFGGGRDLLTASIADVEFMKGDRKNAIARLCQLDGAPMAGLGSIVFLTLGLATTGFLDGEDDDLAFSVFVKGAWDKHLNRLKPFSLVI